MFLSTSPKTFARLFVDLIHKQSGRFANVDPECAIEVGDYGFIDKETGKFEKHGNIFQEKETKSFFDPPENFVKKSATLDFFDIRSFGVTKREIKAKGIIDAVSFVRTSLKAILGFEDERSAAIVMHNSVTHTLTNFYNILKPALDEGKCEHLRKKCLVLEVVTCSSFYSYISNKESEELEISFDTRSPAGSVLGISGGKETPGKWKSSQCGGVSHRGEERPGVEYTPLFRAKTIGKRLFSQRDISNPCLEERKKDGWLDSEVPWNKLDEDGNEVKEKENEEEESSDEEG